eukprot:TRINITY_DN18914_c0_g1_i1.p1 TRINITY_DN18914_c0_g1~~TRINITY_DN18914_c0_g1_i1.p1  ORF type:complete len:345 (+),score=61.18 TRINITY_DN18914_c0_g1_i1:179-1213(+)
MFTIVDYCGGHMGVDHSAYHFHQLTNCTGLHAFGHSHAVAALTSNQVLYGPFEHEARKELPLLDACGGHFGRTRSSADKDVYHYHVQTRPPFTLGCLGPSDDGGLVSTGLCRSLSPGCDGKLVSIETSAGKRDYDLYCPCFDSAESNTGVNIEELPAFKQQSSKVVKIYLYLRITVGSDAEAIGLAKLVLGDHKYEEVFAQMFANVVDGASDKMVSIPGIFWAAGRCPDFLLKAIEGDSLDLDKTIFLPYEVQAQDEKEARALISAIKKVKWSSTLDAAAKNAIGRKIGARLNILDIDMLGSLLETVPKLKLEEDPTEYTSVAAPAQACLAALPLTAMLAFFIF